jgi:pyruvate,orthophosphate dikinase
LEPLQTQDFTEIFRVMDGYPVTIRLLDPPLHEFLPRHEETLLEITNLKLKIREAGDLQTIDDLMNQINEKTHILKQIERLAESNPMLGHRGCRLGVVFPEITEMQARAIFNAALQCKEEGVDVQVEVMIPLVAFFTEYQSQEAIVRRVAGEIFAERGMKLDYLVGTMIELPRAALMADKIAESAEFFSFGTNDLTQTTLASASSARAGPSSSFPPVASPRRHPRSARQSSCLGNFLPRACCRPRVRPCFPSISRASVARCSTWRRASA